MDLEECERLLADLEEAKGSFDVLISNMKDEGIDYPYEKLIELVDDSVFRIKNTINKVALAEEEYGSVYGDNKSLIRKMKAIRYCRNIVIVLWFYITSHLGRNMDNKAAGYFIGMAVTLAGIFGIDLASENIRFKLTGESKENNGVFRKLAELKDEYFKNRDIASNDIDTIQSINRNLWNEMKEPPVLSLKRRVRVENELKG